MYAGYTTDKRGKSVYHCSSMSFLTTTVTLWLVLANYPTEHSTHLHTFALHDLGTVLLSSTATLDNSLCHTDLQTVMACACIIHMHMCACTNTRTHADKAVIENKTMQTNLSSCYSIITSREQGGNIVHMNKTWGGWLKIAQHWLQYMVLS